MENKAKRIWELDALRGICILCMVLVHIPVTVELFLDVNLNLSDFYWLLRDYGYLFFVLISGICVTLGSHTFKRGLTVLAFAMAVSYVTLFMDYILGFSESRIWFGILHMLGFSMLLYPLFRRFPAWINLIVGIVFIAIGTYFERITVNADYLFPIGLCSDIYTGSDFFPIFPGFGWFLTGSFIGRTVYKNKQTLLPKVNSENALIRFLSMCGRHSLIIYIAHQPVIALIIIIISKTV